MKRLERMLLINWHYIVHDILEFDDVTFLTGKNGAGKSTILDALQLVILGDTSGHFFNKAANDNSRRTLKGYLRGEVAEEEEKGIVYLRDGQFSSYLVLEFTDTQQRKQSCFGVIFDNYPDGSHTHRFFSMDGALPDFHFIRDDTPLDTTGLRQWGQQHKSHALEIYESNKRYQEVFLGKMGRLNDKFLRLFRKAVPFSPIMDVAGFISEFVCDVKHQLDIQDMRENIRHYRRMEQELNHVRKRVHALEQIGQKHQDLEAVRGRVRLYHYLLDRAELHRIEEEANQVTQRIAECSSELERLSAEKAEQEQSVEQWQTRRDELMEEKAQSNEYVQQQKLQGEKNLLETQFTQVRAAGERQSRIFEQQMSCWKAVHTGLREAMDWFIAATQAASALGNRTGWPRDASEDAPSAGVRHGFLGTVEPLLESAGQALQSALSNLPKPYDWRGRALLHADLEANRVDMKALERATTSLTAASEALREGHRMIRDTVTAWEQEETTLRRAIEELRRGIKQYDPKVVRLQKEIQEGLHSGTGNEVRVAIFADLLDVQRPDWQQALEGYLDKQRFYLMVPPEHFVEALSIYDRVKKDLGIFDVGLVDIAKIMEQHPERLAGSLAEEIETDDPYARAYADYLLGRVMKCDRAEDLRQHRTAITKDGMLYHNFVARQMNPRRWETMYIGKRAIAQQLEQKTDRLEMVRTGLEMWKPRLGLVKGWAEQPVLTPSDLETVREAQNLLDGLAELQDAYREVLNRLGSLDLTRLTQLDEWIAESNQALERLRKQVQDVATKQGRVINEHDSLKTRTLPLLDEQMRDAKLALTSNHDPLFAADEGEPRFAQELKRLGSVDSLVANFRRQRATDANRQDQFHKDLVDLRITYNRDFQAGFDVQKPENDAYERELNWLRDSQVTEYEEKIREAKDRAQVQFQEDFISKLRNNVETVQDQIRELNEAIRSVPFGRDRYRFQVRANPQYERFYQMITDDMLLEGYSLFSQTFQERHGDTIEELFRNIVDVDEQAPSAQTELEKNLHKFTDYRTYLDFDLIVKDEEGRESRLSRVIAKKSGGETQTPFYISVLASFAQLYRVRQIGLDNTLRLLVFDEAYSKMDHQRIRESIRLIRDLGLQVILSAPTEKIADIVPQVDRTLVVTRIRSETRVSAFDPKHDGA